MKGLTLTAKEQAKLSIMNMILDRNYGVKEAAQLVGLSERHMWRLLAAYRREGAAALAHGNRGRLPSNAKSPILRTQVIELARSQYQGANHSHLTELLFEREGIALSRSTVRRLLVGDGLVSPRRRRPPSHRCRRQRMPQEGMLVQIDGSHHGWLEDRGGNFTLLLAIDDATGSVPFALFQEQEDTAGYFELLKGIIERKGLPLALYSDRHVVFRSASTPNKNEEATFSSKTGPTQFGRAMRDLGVTQIFAQSPEAKGRIERANGTFQDRLVTELRLADARTIAEANIVLEDFVPRFNQRFGVPASQQEFAYRPLDAEVDLDAILCFKEYRRVGKDNTVQYRGQTLQLFPDTERASYARTRVEVQERLDGQLVVCYHGKSLNPKEAPPLAAALREMATLPLPKCYEFEEPEKEEELPLPPVQPRSIWYEDSELRRLHGELTRSGMERARERGKQLGRPKVTDRPGFEQHLDSVASRITSGEISRTQGARELAISSGTLKLLLDARLQKKKESLAQLFSGYPNEMKALAEVAY
jgi:transposase